MARLLLALALALAAIGGVSADATAKEGVHARLVQPIPRDAEPGSRLRIAWTLEDAQGHPFGASGLFVRVVGIRGSASEAEVDGVGRFAAEVVVPEGGIRDITFGLRGWRQTGGNGSRERADISFPLRGDAFAVAPPPQDDSWLPLGLAALAAAGLLLLARRRRAAELRPMH